MKKLFFLTVAVTALYSCTSNKYVIEGNLKGLDEYVYMTSEEGQVIDSVKAENGVFSFKGIAENPAVNYIQTNANSQNKLLVIVFPEPGKITLNGKVEEPMEIYPSGTKANNEYSDYLRKNRELAKRHGTLGRSIEERKAIMDELLVVQREALAKNQDNYFGAILLAWELADKLPASEILDAVSSLPEPIQKMSLLRKVKSEAKDKMKTEPGQPYINIVQNDAQNQPIALKNAIENPANKYVLVDFWASWCRPCMMEAPFLTKVYKQYHAKGFEIYGVSFDSEKEEWAKAIKEYGMNWIQVSSFNRFVNEAARDYGVRSIPSNYLIDCATGKIVAVNLHDEALESKLAELLK